MYLQLDHTAPIGHIANPLTAFLAEQCYRVNGAATLFSEFAERYRNWLPREERFRWSNYRLSRALREGGILVGSHTANQKIIGNLSFAAGKPDGEYIVVAGDKRKGQARRLVRVSK